MKKYLHQVQEYYLVFKQQQNSGKLSSANILQTLAKPINSDIRELLKPLPQIKKK